MSRRSSHDPSSPRLQPRGRLDLVVWFGFDWIDLCADLRVWLVSGDASRGGGEPAVRLPAPGQGAAAPGLRRRRAELLRKGGAFTGEIRLLVPLCFEF